jgi:predicted dehydrogenase
MGGGRFPFVFGHSCHFFSAARYLADCEKIESISAIPCPVVSPTSGEIAMLQWKAGDIVGSWINTRETFSDSGFRIKLFGTEGTLEVLGEGAGAKVFGSETPHISIYRDSETKYLNVATEEEVVWRSNLGYYYESHKNELKHFVSCIVEDRDPIYTAEDGRKEVLYTLASIKSVLEGRVIRPDEIPVDFTPMNV